MTAPVGHGGDALPVPYHVVRRDDASPGTSTLVLEPADAPLPPFRPGQFAMVYAFGAGDAPVSVSAVEGDRLFLTVRSVGGVSGALRGGGRTVGVRGPFGNGWAEPGEGDVLVVAGGIGLAPLRPLIRRILRSSSPHVEVNVLIGARGPRDLLYGAETRDWQAAGARVLVTVDRPDATWQGDVGVVTALLERAVFDPAGVLAYVCGPEVMIRSVARDLVHRGVAADRIQVSLERTMHCGTGHCGHCQLGPLLLCQAGPVATWDLAGPLLFVREL